MERTLKSKIAFYVLAVIIVCAMLLLGIRPAGADTWGVATLRSYHTDRAVEHNERNFGLGIEHDIAANTRLIVGFYDNSFDRTTVYAGVAYAPWCAGPFRFGVLAAFGSGYGDRPYPVILPAVLIEGPRFGANLGIVPRTQNSPGIIGLQLKAKF